MSKTFNLSFMPKSLIASVLLTGAAFPALAQNLNITGDSVTVTSGGGFNSGALVIPRTTGIVPTVTLPNLAIQGGTAIPNFTFALASSGVADGTYEFTAGFVVDDDNSARRIEITIPTITMTFSAGGTVLSGSVPSGSSVNVRGRAADNTTTLSASLSNTLFNFSGTSLSFTAGTQVTEIQTKGGILGDIATTISAQGGYSYAVVLKQTSGSAALNFGTIATAFTKLGCAPASAFVLGSNSSTFTGGFGLQGQFLIVAGTNGTAPTAFADACTTAIASGGGGGSTATQTAATNAVDTASSGTTTLLNTITASTTVTPAVITSFNNLVTETATTVTTVITGIAAGTVSVDTGITLLSSLAKQMEVGSKVTTLGGEVSATVLASVLTNFEKVLTALPKTTLTAQQTLLLTTQLASTVGLTAELLTALRGKFGLLSSDPLVSYDAITLDTSIADVTAIVNEVEKTINTALTISGVQVTAGTFNSLQNVSQAALELLFKPTGAQLGLSIAHNTNVATQTLLTQNSTLLERLLDSTAINFGTSSEVSAATVQTALTTAGLSTAFAASLATNLTAYVKPDTLSVDSGSGLATVSSRLQAALSATTLSVNQTTGVINYTTATESHTAHLLSVMPAPAAFPASAVVLPDGSRYLVSGNLAFVIAPAISDVTGFAAALNTVGAGKFSTALTASGNIILNETLSNIKFLSATSSFSNTAVTSTGSTTFAAPTGNPALASYVFTVQHANGTRQSLVPVIADIAFIRSVGNYGFKLTTDKANGTIQIGNFSFRPDYFQTPLTSADSLFLNGAKDSSGVAYRPVDANKDGKTDYQVLTSTGVQTFYGLQ